MTSLVAHRRALHQIPELTSDLPKTQAYLTQALSQLPCQLLFPTPSSVCAYFDFSQPTTVGLRADMDGLPVVEVTGVDYVSCHGGQMHACGHDGHMAILLETAQRIAQLDTLPRNVLLLFQPAEEAEGGARPLCESGILTQFHVERIFGLHLWPKVEKGAIYSRPGPLLARANEVTVDVVGKSVHLSRAEEGVDALLAGIDYLQEAYAFVEGLDPEIPRKFRFGKMESGTVCNAISGHTHLEGSLRAYSDDVYALCKHRLESLGEEISSRYGCQIAVDFNEGYPPVWNPEDFYQQISAQLGDCAPATLAAPVLAGEDFSYYQQHVPALFFFLGLGDVPELHAGNFNFDDEAILPKGVEFFLELVGLE